MHCKVHKTKPIQQLHSTDMVRMTTDELLQSIFTDSDVESDGEDYGPIVEGSDDDFDSMCEDWEDSDSESNDSDDEVGSEPGHQQAKLVNTDRKYCWEYNTTNT